MDEKSTIFQQNRSMTHTNHESLQELSPYLDGKRHDLAATIASLKKDRRISTQAKEMVPVVQACIRDVTLWYQQACQQRKEQQQF